MIGAHFYSTYSISVTPDSITVVHPFRGTKTLTHQSISAVKNRYFKGVRLLEVTYRDGSEPRKIKFDVSRFDLGEFFGSYVEVKKSDQRELDTLYNKYGIVTPQVGDLFLILVNLDRAYIGQVIAFCAPGIPFIVVYDFAVPVAQAVERANEAMDAPILLAGATFDSRFRPGMWAVVGSGPVHPEEILPAYRTGPRIQPTIHSFTGSARRPATEGEYDRICADSFYSPHIFDVLLQAHEGLCDSFPAAEDLFHRWPTSMEVFGQL